MVSSRTLHTLSENAERPTIQQEGLKRLSRRAKRSAPRLITSGQPKRENCSKKEVFQHIPKVWDTLANLIKNSKDIFVFLAILVTALNIGALAPVFADYLPVPQSLCGPFPCPQGTTGVDVTRNLVTKIVDNVRYVIGAVAIVVIIISGLKLVFASGNEEVFSKQTTTLIYAVLGLAFVGLAGEISRIFDVENQGFLKDPSVSVQRARLFNRTLQIIVTFIKYIIGSVAVLFVIRNSLRLVLASGSEDEITKDKKSIFYGLLGLILIIVADPIIKQVFFKIDTSTYPGLNPVRPGIDYHRLALEIAGITNVVASIAGPFALLSLLAGGLMYIIAAGDDEKIGRAKKMIMWSIIGLIIIYGSFALVSTFVARQFSL